MTLALSLAGGAERPIDTEDVAMKAHELAPTRFAWRKYPQQINLELVRVYLSDAKNPKKGGYVDGSGRTGWTLTPRGAKWAHAQRGKLGQVELDRRRDQARGGSPTEQRWRRERERVISSDAWSRWQRGERSFVLREAEALFRIDSYAVGRLRLLKTQRLLALFESDDELRPFLDQAAAAVAVAEQ